jgi:raffinose/stachyose/melibiose transport system permease protein
MAYSPIDSHIERKRMSLRIKFSRDNMYIIPMLLPTLTLFLVFSVYPIINVFYTSFFDYNGITDMKWIGIYNYLRVMRDSSWWITVWNTVHLGIGIPLVQIPLSLMLAVFLNGQIKGRGFFRAFFFLPNITSTAIMGIIFSFMFASYNGIVNGFLMQMGIIGKPIEWLGHEYLAKLTIVIFSTWAGTGFYMVLFLAGLQKIPKDLYESAAIDGATGIQSFFKITIPMLGQMFQIITMLSILSAMRLFDTVKVLTMGGPGNKTEVMTMYIFRYYFEPSGGGMQQGYASAVATVGLMITAIVAGIYLLSTKEMGQEH